MDSLKNKISNLSKDEKLQLLKKLKEKTIASESLPEISPLGNRSEYALSLAQKRLWFLSNLNREESSYNITALIKISGDLNPDALSKSFSIITDRHKVLLSRILLKNGEPVCVLRKDFKVEITSLQFQSGVDAEKQVIKIAERISETPLNLTFDDLFTVTVYNTCAREYYLLLNIHHTLADGLSIKLLIEELTELYSSFVKGQKPSLPELKIQYFDYAEWQNKFLSTAYYENHINYWKNQLKNIPELNINLRKIFSDSTQGKHFDFELPSSLNQKLKAFCGERNISPFTFLLTIFAIVLYRYFHQEDFGIGVPIANRKQKEVEKLIGFFVNTIIIRTSLCGNPVFNEVLQKINDTALDAFDKHDVPFEKIVDAVTDSRNKNLSHLFNVMFDYQEDFSESFQLHGLECKQIPFERGTSKFDLMLMISESKNKISASFEYRTDLFDEQIVARMSEHFLKLSEAFIKNPSAKISDMDFLTEAEWQKIKNTELAEYSMTYENKVLIDYFNEQVENYPNSPAVSLNETTLTFKELNEKAEFVANKLLNNRVQPDDIVGLFTERSVESIIGIVGILKSGAAYLPLDPRYPKDRISAIISEASPKVTIIQKALAENIKGIKTYPIIIEDVLSSDHKTENLVKAKPDPENLAYVIYTSGSTGKPKGVMLTNRSVVNLAESLEKQIYSRLGKKRITISLNAPLLFDASVQQIVMMLKGHHLRIIPDDIRLDGRAFVDHINSYRIELLDCVPTQLKLLLMSGLFEGNSVYPYVLLPGGEAIDQLLWDTLRKASDKLVFNMYGPTECAVDSTMCFINSESVIPSIGTPLKNITVYVLDKFLNPVPEGCEGELYLGGKCVGRGYFNRPDITAENFIPDFFSNKEGTRLYKTGDLVRVLADGEIEFIGRVDNQEKIRGFRIELNEIESMIKEFDEVDEAVAKIISNESGDKKLVSFIKTTNQLNRKELKDYLRKRLPDYMVPVHFIEVDEFPTTPNGKIDRKALRVTGNLIEEENKAVASEETLLGKLITDLCAETLKLKLLVLNDNFFEIGGDSILAAVFTNKLQARLKADIHVKSVFLTPVLSDLENYIRKEFKEAVINFESGKNETSTKIIPRIIERKNQPLSLAQKRLWFLFNLEPDNPFYNIFTVLEIKGKLNVPLLELSFNKLIERHEILRTYFLETDDKPVQVIAEKLEIKIDLLELPQKDRNDSELIKEIAQLEAKKCFDLRSLPLLRVSLLRIDEENYVLMTNIHHIIADGWSFNILIKELGHIYNSLENNLRLQLDDLRIQYLDYSQWQVQQFENGLLQKQVEFWKQNLSESEFVLTLPTDMPRPPVQSFNGAWKEFVLSSEHKQILSQISKNNSSTLFVTLLSAFQVLLSKYSGQNNFCIGTPVANRNHPEIEKLIGFFVNLIVLKAKLKSKIKFSELVRMNKEISIQAFAHQELPFEVLVDNLKPDRELSHSPIFQVMFAFQNIPSESLEIKGLRLKPMIIDSGIAKYDLTLSMTDSENGITGTLEYNSDIFKPDTISSMINHFNLIIDQVSQDQDILLEDISLVDETEKFELEIELNNTERKFNSTGLIHKDFEEQARLNPELTALLHDGASLKYRQLNEKANQLARFLIEQGAANEKVIALFFHRSIDLMVAILGVLKSGAAYLPLDVNVPSERLSYYLNDSQSIFIISSSGLKHKLPQDSGLKIIEFEDIQFNKYEIGNLKTEVDPLNKAYIIYTSGSTGRPKGVIISHLSACNLGHSYIYEFETGPGIRVFNFFAPCFDGSVADYLMSLFAGATLIIPNHENVLPGPDLIQALEEYNANISVINPTTLLNMNESELPYLTTLIAGAESCPKQLFEKWGKNRIFYNAYGPTETTVAASYYKVEHPENLNQNIPIGRPLPNLKFYVLDKNLKQVPVGIPGELYIGGIQIARGYHNKADLTAEKFIPDLFTQKSGERMYRTGDLVKITDDFNIEFIERIDNQVKLRGYRIETDEIEYHLKKFEGIKEAKAFIKSNEDNEKHLVAYLIKDQSAEISSDVLSKYLRNKVPSYMVPSAFVFIDFFPMTSGGKIDTNKLPVPDSFTIGITTEYLQPETDVQKTLASIWCEVLKLEKVGIKDNFFELGGDSILTLQVASRARQKGIEITPKQIFQNPTIEMLSSVSFEKSKIVATQEMITGISKLLPVQKWFFKQKFEQPHHWNQSVLLEISHDVDFQILEKSFNSVIEHHDALRLRFYEKDGELLGHFVNENYELTIEAIKIHEGSDHFELEEAIRNYQSKLNFVTGRIIGAAIFYSENGNRRYLLIAIHHLVIDTVSWQILLEDLIFAYERIIQNQPVQFQPKTTEYCYWADRLEKLSQTDYIQNQTKYWEMILSHKSRSIPKDFEQIENLEKDLTTLKISADKDLTDRIQKKSNELQNFKLNEVLLAVVSTSLIKWIGSNSLKITMESHGREIIFDDVDISRTTGWFTSAYPLLLKFSKSYDLKSNLVEVKEAVRNIPDNGIGYGILRYNNLQSKSEFNLSIEPEISFNFLGIISSEQFSNKLFRRTEGINLSERGAENHRVNLIDISVEIFDGRLYFHFGYNKKIHRGDTIQKIADDVLSLLVDFTESTDSMGRTYSPSDFKDVKIEQEELNEILNEIYEDNQDE
jgi:amino acid adenylation domain-containing protein/non-ribosomal peptide synthase protein (TIGR01720 family)